MGLPPFKMYKQYSAMADNVDLHVRNSPIIPLSHYPVMLLVKMMMKMKMVMKMLVMLVVMEMMKMVMMVIEMKMMEMVKMMEVMKVKMMEKMMVIGMKMMEMMKMKMMVIEMKMMEMMKMKMVMVTKVTDDGDKDEDHEHEEPETSCGSFWSQLRIVSKETKQASFLQKTKPLPRKALCLEGELGSVGKVGSRGCCRHQAAWLGPSLSLDLLLCKPGW